jgi:hypothetical protein
MANAKKCDICGKYYDVPELIGDLAYDNNINTSMVRILRRNDSVRINHDVMQFDSCEGCLQDILDYILTKRADSEPMKGD